MPQDPLCFGAFLRELARAYSKSLGRLYSGQRPVHVASDLVVPDNTVPLHLPSYSLETGPVERPWQDLKRQIDVFDATVRSSLAGPRDHVAEIICRYTDETVATLTGYAYLIDAVNALQC